MTIIDKKDIYVAITGDVVQSRKAGHKLMDHLAYIIKEMNDLYSPLVPFSIQSGDEIQGLVQTNSKPFLLLTDFLRKSYPLNIRWGIGLGTISSSVLNTTAEMRGDAFEFSRKALNFLNNKRYFFYVLNKNNSYKEINIILKLISGYLLKWNQITYHRFSLYSQYETIYKVAELENVSIEAINKYLNRSGIREIIDCIGFLDEFVEKCQPYRVDK